jgi:5-formyltetrahydrofolate cyclo-ligase
VTEPSTGTSTDRSRIDVLRRRGRDARLALTGERRLAASADVVAALLAWCDELAVGRPAPTIALSLPADGEVDVAAAAPVLRDRGWRIHLPVVLEDRRMEFVAWDAGDELAPNRFGIGEPVGGERVPVSTLDVVVLPCVAVDRRGHRLGFGAGYYDRALAEVRGDRPQRVGAVFEVQVLEEVPSRPWDVPLHWVISEAGVRRTGPADPTD